MSVYKIVEIVGTSPKSWEDAARPPWRRPGNHWKI